MIIEIKLNIPLVKKNIVRRENIMNIMKRVNEYKVVQVTAPAGYGKTMAIADD